MVNWINVRNKKLVQVKNLLSAPAEAGFPHRLTSFVSHSHSHCTPTQFLQWKASGGLSCLDMHWISSTNYIINCRNKYESVRNGSVIFLWGILFTSGLLLQSVAMVLIIKQLLTPNLWHYLVNYIIKIMLSSSALHCEQTVWKHTNCCSSFALIFPNSKFLN